MKPSIVQPALSVLLVTFSAHAMTVVAHRGLWQETGLPQNTVEAIQKAYEVGFTAVETDFVETESGDIICLHDRKALASLSTIVKEPRTITPADRAAINLGEKAHLPRPYRIPLLRDVLAVVPKNGLLQAEIKVYGKTYARQFDEAVKAAGLSETNITVSCFNARTLADFHARYPKYRTLWLGADITGTGLDLEAILRTARRGGFDIICPGCAAAQKCKFTPADAARLRAAGFDVRLYGVNSPQQLAYAASVGATAFTCNTPLAAYGWARNVKGLNLSPRSDTLHPDAVAQNPPSATRPGGASAGR